MGKFHIVFPPFIDAYRTSNESTLKKFKEDMKQNAIQWGLQSIGEQFVTTGEVQTFDGRPVVQCGEFKKQKYVAVIEPGDGYWFERIKTFKSDYPREWDVT